MQFPTRHTRICLHPCCFLLSTCRCNYFAQADALALGKDAAQLEAENTPADLIPHKTFTGAFRGLVEAVTWVCSESLIA